MKISAIYNVYDGEELLELSILQIREDVNNIIAVVQDVSNYGNFYEGGGREAQRLKEKGLIDDIVFFTPMLDRTPAFNELHKRKIGIDNCKDDYFILMDCDEFYDKDHFKKMKDVIIANSLECTYAHIRTYFKHPTLCFENFDNYVVPFICKNKGSELLGGKMGALRKGIDVDPTRSYGLKEVFGLPIVMDHYSWVRNNIHRKINNSTAKKNIEKANILSDWQNATDGYILKSNKKKLILAFDKYKINDKCPQHL